ncbi:glutamyl-tRNA synthetase [Deinobacterium chartae]|uniref:Glutamyl-Q tRNA(Asp) synthetase n=1 Tax=Deinobacterium chartae TaxID=521158 RepID=A0A841HVQ1_9DEIO|nr:tRNA glutamyl-Q(34) synthetase GluQRS [Deinobacterium chartae]MBB6096744.1 glutamyl-tRNA synthetase [Deinobacterium chartae]
MMPTGRFAPSPTGRMHLGNARTALLAWLHSRALGARHLLRIEDLDTTRVRPGAEEDILRDLEWLGLTWDGFSRQSDDLAPYAQALERLETYRCNCSRRQVLEAASAPHGREAVYPGTCRHRPPPPEQPAAVRWRTPPGVVCFHDALEGEHCQDLTLEVGDFPLCRADGVFAYHLAVVVDDARFGVTEVLRGCDLLQSTPRQIALQRALGYPTPRYLHVPLMTDYQGQRLAKRGGAPAVAELRTSGYPAPRLLSELAGSLGWAVPPEVRADELIPLWRANLDNRSKL